MAEILAALSISTEGLSLCVRAIAAIKKLSTEVRDARANINTVLNLLGRMRNRLELVRVTLLALRDQNGDAGILSAFISFSQGLNSALQKVHQETSCIVEGASRISIAKRLTWALNRTRIQELILLLERESRQLIDEFTILNSLTSLRTQRDVEKLGLLSDKLSEPKVAFSDHDFVDRRVGTSAPPSRVPRTTRIWLGHVLRENRAAPYLALRDQLSDAAYLGDWEYVFETLDQGLERFGESWVNAPRMKPKSEHAFLSMWLPLHQAVYLHAPVEVVQKLLDLGALRTLRTRTTEFTYDNMSALELAHELEVFHLYEILQLTIKRPVPLTTLQHLENNFHHLIRAEVGRRTIEEKLYLPVLEALTELDGDTVWFPIHLDHESAGYLYRLVGRELQVKSLNIHQPGKETLYLITEDEILETDEIFNFAGDVERSIQEMTIS